MAAHFLTYLKEAIELDEQGKFDDRQVHLFVQALDFGGDCDFVDWQNLHCKFPSNFIKQVKECLPKYEQLWNELGCPKTHEEWLKALHSAKAL
jgi:hypothetical protein